MKLARLGSAEIDIPDRVPTAACSMERPKTRLMPLHHRPGGPVLRGEGLDEGDRREGLLEVAPEPGILLALRVAERVHPAGEIAHRQEHGRQGEDDADGKSPLQVKEKGQAASESKDILHDVDDVGREEGRRPVNVPDEAGHQVAGLILVKECFRETKDPVEEVALDVEDEFLLVAREPVALQRADDPAEDGKPHHEEDHHGQQVESLPRDDVVDEEAADEGLGEGHERTEKDEPAGDSPLPPMAPEERQQPPEALSERGIRLPAGHPVLGRLPRQAVLQIFKPAFHKRIRSPLSCPGARPAIPAGAVRARIALPTERVKSRFDPLWFFYVPCPVLQELAKGPLVQLLHSCP